MYNRAYRPIPVGIPRARAAPLPAASVGPSLVGLRLGPARLPAKPHPLPSQPVHPPPGSPAGPGQSGKPPDPYPNPDQNPVAAPRRLSPPHGSTPADPRALPAPWAALHALYLELRVNPPKISQKPSLASPPPFGGRGWRERVPPSIPPSAAPPRRCPRRPSTNPSVYRL